MNFKELREYLADQDKPFLLRASTLISQNLTLGVRVSLGEVFLKAVTTEERNRFEGKISEIEGLMQAWRARIDANQN